MNGRHSTRADGVRERGNYRNGFLRGFVSALGTVLLILLVGLAVAVAVVPFATHGRALAVLSGSMEPTFSAGDLIVVKGVDDPDSIPVGTIVTFMPYPDDPTLITHRIVGKGVEADGEIFYTTQGDANNAADEPVYTKQVRGIYLYHLPRLGYVSNWVGGESRTAVVLIGIALLGYAAYQVIFAGRIGRRRKDDAVASETPPAAGVDGTEGESRPDVR